MTKTQVSFNPERLFSIKNHSINCTYKNIPKTLHKVSLLSSSSSCVQLCKRPTHEDFFTDVLTVLIVRVRIALPQLFDQLPHSFGTQRTYGQSPVLYKIRF